MIDRHKFEVARARLTVVMGKQVYWNEIAHMAGLSEHTVTAIRVGRTGGSARTVQKLVEMFRSKGVAISMRDLVS